MYILNCSPPPPKKKRIIFPCHLVSRIYCHQYQLHLPWNFKLGLWPPSGCRFSKVSWVMGVPPVHFATRSSHTLRFHPHPPQKKKASIMIGSLMNHLWKVQIHKLFTDVLSCDMLEVFQDKQLSTKKIDEQTQVILLLFRLHRWKHEAQTCGSSSM